MMPAPFIELEVQYVDKASFDRSLAVDVQVGTRVDRSTEYHLTLLWTRRFPTVGTEPLQTCFAKQS